MRTLQKIIPLAILAGLTFGVGFPARGQDAQGPMAPPPKFEVKRLSNVPNPGPPPIPAEEMIKRLAANEDIMKKQFEAYNFTRTIRIEELSDPGGKFSVSGEMYVKPNGQRYFHATGRAESNLKQSNYSLEDVYMLMRVPVFILTTEEIPNYTLSYAGQEKLDQLDTYILRVKPRQLSRTHRLFDGLVWVDTRDFVIVKSYGQFVNDIAGSNSGVPFTLYETFRENFQDKYWLPTYTRSDEMVKQQDGSELHLRLVIRDTDFALASSAPASAPTSAPAPPTPAATQTQPLPPN